MKKRLIVTTYNVLCGICAVTIIVAEVAYPFYSGINKATRPSIFEYLLSIVPPVCSAVLFLFSVLPVRKKVGANHLSVERLTETMLWFCVCASVVLAFFEIRIEYLYRMFFINFFDVEKIMQCVFYILLLVFLKKKLYAIRMSAIILGTGYIVSIVLYYGSVLKATISVSKWCAIAGIGMWVITLCLFVSLERALYAQVIKKTMLPHSYSIGRFISKGNHYLLAVTEEFSIYSVYNYNTQIGSIVHTEEPATEFFNDLEVATEFQLMLNEIIRQESHNSLL